MAKSLLGIKGLLHLLLALSAISGTALLAQPGPPAKGVDSAALRGRISKLPATNVELNKAATVTSVHTAPSPALGQAASVRYVPLPPEEVREVRKVLTQQLVVKKLGSVDLPIAFNAAVLTQTADKAEVSLIPLAMVDDPLRFNVGSKQFEGRIAVGLVELGYNGPPKAIAAPIGFQVFGDATTEPEIEQVATTSPPFRIFRVLAPDPRDSIELSVFSNLSAEPVKLRLPVQRSRLVLSAKTRLQGWGLERTDVTVASSDGEASKGQTVVLEAPLGNLTADRLILGDDGTARTSFRSESTGTTRLTATGARLESSTLDFQFDFPTRYLVASVIGGFGGGLLKRGMKRSGSTKRLALELFLGVLTGAVVFGLFALGVNIIGFGLPHNGGEVLVAVVAALGAFWGTRLFEAKT